MLKRFPHTISYETAGTGGGWDPDTGLPLPYVPGATVEVECRPEPNVRQEYITKEDDGQIINFDWLIHMDKSTDRVPFGQQVTVKGPNGEEVASGTVVRSHKNQLHNQIWI